MAATTSGNASPAAKLASILATLFPRVAIIGRPRSFSVEWHHNQWCMTLTTGRKRTSGKPERMRVPLGHRELRRTDEDKEKARVYSAELMEEVSKSKLMFVGKQPAGSTLAEIPAAPSTVTPPTHVAQFAGVPTSILVQTAAQLEAKWRGMYVDLASKGTVADATCSAELSRFHARFIPELGDVPMWEFFTDGGISKICAWVVKVAGTRTRKGALPMTDYVHHIVGAARKFFDDCRIEGWIPRCANPMNHPDVRLTISRHTTNNRKKEVKHEDIVHWTRETVEKFLASILADPPPDVNPTFWFGLILLAVLTGLRDGELHGLTFRHVLTRARQDGDTPYVMVRQQVIQASLGKPARIAIDRDGKPKLKTKSSYGDVPLHGLAVDFMSFWEDHGWEDHVGRSPTLDDLVFPDSEGKPWRPEDAEMVRKLLKNGGLPTQFRTREGALLDFELKTARATFSQWLEDAEVPDKVVDALLRHDDHLDQVGKVRRKHYSRKSMAVKAKAIETIRLNVAIPTACALRSVSSPESSPLLPHDRDAQRNMAGTSIMDPNGCARRSGAGVSRELVSPLDNGGTMRRDSRLHCKPAEDREETPSKEAPRLPTPRPTPAEATPWDPEESGAGTKVGDESSVLTATGGRRARRAGASAGSLAAGVTPWLISLPAGISFDAAFADCIFDLGARRVSHGRASIRRAASFFRRPAAVEAMMARGVAGFPGGTTWLVWLPAGAAPPDVMKASEYETYRQGCIALAS